MALTQLKDTCMLCGKKFEQDEKATFIGRVTCTYYGRSGTDHGMSFGGAWNEVKQGKVRIKHLVGGKPRGLICTECTEKLGLK